MPQMEYSRKFDYDKSPLTSGDGRLLLTLLGFDSSRDGGGYIYRFVLLNPTYTSATLSGNILIARVGCYSASKYYKEKGVDIDDMTLMEERLHIDEYIFNFGEKLWIKEMSYMDFDINLSGENQFDELGYLISQAYFNIYSIKSKHRTFGSIYFTDEMHFSPLYIGGNYGGSCSFSRTYTPEETARPFSERGAPQVLDYVIQSSPSGTTSDHSIDKRSNVRSRAMQTCTRLFGSIARWHSKF
jgi:hypothetical protein